MTRDEIVRIIGSIIDHPSVYMGGASQQSMRKAERILEALAASGYAFVPVRPTDEMITVGAEWVGDAVKTFRAYRAMISAATGETNE